MQDAVASRYSIKPSLRFAVSLLLSHMMAAIVAYATAMPWLIKLTILILIAMSLFFYLARDILLLFPDSWREIALGQNGVSVIAYAGSSFFGQVANETVVSPYCIVLNVRREGRRLPVVRVIFPDALSAGEFRELCVRLKFA